MGSRNPHGPAEVAEGRPTSDAACFEACVRPWLPSLRASALRLTRNTHDADDLVQETVLRAWRFFAHYRHDSHCRAWLHRIQTNTFCNRYRAARRERERLARARDMELVSEPASFEPNLARDSLCDEVQNGLARLPAEFRNVLWAVAVDDMSYKDAADALGCPIGTVMSRLHRARRAAQTALAAHAHALGQA